MFSKYIILFKNIKYGAIPSCSRTRHTFSLRSQLETFLKNSAKFNNSPSLRYISSKGTSSSKPFSIAVGSAVIGGIVGAYAYFKKSKPTDNIEETDDIEDIPFVYEHLEEDLALLKEYGKVPYLLIGAGSASFAAYRAIRTSDPNAKILMIGEESFFPYVRTPLSKEMWFDTKQDSAETLSFTQWDGKNRSLFYEPPDYYFSVKEMLENKNGGVSVIRGTKVIKVDPVSQTVYLDKGGEVSYEKCLIATGSKSKNIPVFETADDSIRRHVTMFRTIHDFRKLNKLCKKINSLVIVGGGFLGSELAYGVARQKGLNAFKVTQIFPETGNMGNILPEYLSKWTTNKLVADGINVITEANVKAVTKEGNKLLLQLSDGRVIETDHVLVAVGADPNTELALSSGLEVDEKLGGFVVNAEMEARKNLWVAGDVSCFYDVVLGRRRVEHHDHAQVSGRLAGKNMTGSGDPYSHQSMFWSDLGPDIGYEGIGIVDSSLPTVGVFVKGIEKSTVLPSDIDKPGVDASYVPLAINKETESAQIKDPKERVPRAPQKNDNYDRGVIFYLKNEVIVGIVLWNVFYKMSIARKIIRESKSYQDLTEVAKLFDLNSSEELD